MSASFSSDDTNDDEHESEVGDCRELFLLGLIELGSQVFKKFCFELKFVSIFMQELMPFVC